MRTVTLVASASVLLAAAGLVSAFGWVSAQQPPATASTRADDMKPGSTPPPTVAEADAARRAEQLRNVEALIERFRSDLTSKEQAIRRMYVTSGNTALASESQLVSEVARREIEFTQTESNLKELEEKIAQRKRFIEADNFKPDESSVTLAVDADPNIAALVRLQGELRLLVLRETAVQEGSADTPTVRNLK